MAPHVEYERAWLAEGYQAIAGIDEAGRGCWAGPVVAAAVVLPPTLLAKPGILSEVNDSKLLTAATRQRLPQVIAEQAWGIGVGVVPAYLIDGYGIVPATRLAMTIARLSLRCPCEALLIDAVKLPELGLPQRSLVRGDSTSLVIAAASVIAKVTRDRLMRMADRAWPEYGFGLHKGYGTALHQSALAQHGICPIHRLTFRPISGYAILPSDSCQLY